MDLFTDGQILHLQNRFAEGDLIEIHTDIRESEILRQKCLEALVTCHGDGDTENEAKAEMYQRYVEKSNSAMSLKMGGYLFVHNAIHYIA